MGGKIGRRRNRIDRHLAQFIVRARESVVHADGEDRQVVEEKRVEVIGIEHHDDIRPRRGKFILLRREQLGDFAVRAVALGEEGKDGCVRHAEPGDDLCHYASNSCCSRRWRAHCT